MALAPKIPFGVKGEPSVSFVGPGGSSSTVVFVPLSFVENLDLNSSVVSSGSGSGAGAGVSAG
jgi:hypothetical protein